MIIDSGSFENVVSTEMVQKLGLKTVPHLKSVQVDYKWEMKLKPKHDALFHSLLASHTRMKCGVM